MTVNWILEHADCLDAMREMPEASIDAVVTDPPYGLSFMNKGWDHGVPGVEFWLEALRVTKPFAGSGTTGLAALEEGFMFVGIEREAEYAEIARKRLEGRKA